MADAGASTMDVDTPPKVAAPNQRAVAAVAVAPPARKGRHWATQQQSPPPRDSSWSPVSREQVKAVMTRYRQLQTEFWSSQLQQAPRVLPANQELLQQRVAELMRQRTGKPLVADNGDAAAEAEAAGPAAAAGGGGKQADRSSSRPPAGDEQAAAAEEQQHGGRGHSKARTSDSSGGSSGDDDSSGSSSGSDADDEDDPRAQQQPSAGRQQQRQQQPGRPRHHGKKARAVYGRYSTNEVKLLKKRAYRLHYEQRLPAYVSWMYLVRNELAVDKGQRMFYTDETGETVPASDDEDGNLKPWQSKGGQSHDYALMRLAEEHAADLGGLFAVLEVGLEERSENVTADELAARLRQLREAEAPKMPPTEEERRAAPFAESLSTFHRHFCRRCNIYNCRLHGGGHVQPVLQPPPPPPPAPDTPPCCSSCWRAVQHPAAAAADAGAAAAGSSAAAAAAAMAAASPGGEPGAAAAAGGAAAAAPEFDDYEEGLLQEGLKVFGRDPCSLALLLAGRSCAEIGQHLQLQLGDAAQAAAEEGAAEPLATDAAAAARKRKKRAATVTVPARKHVMHRRWQLSGDEEWAPYSPCSCAGPCKKGSCPCIASANFCEKFCCCVGCEKRDCTFQGCTCTTRCRNERCPCMAAGRECDPDVCRNCTTTARGTAAPDERCGNMGMRLRKHARLHMGLSNVSGWGAFLGEAARKGDFLGEYVGEMLSQQEADRRGKAYDRSNNSYLFGVNKEWVLDAKACGNKLRFANHRSHPNCQTRVLMVDGDHRVGIYAKEDIAAGEELFYNYRYDLDNAPDWAIRE